MDSFRTALLWTGLILLSCGILVWFAPLMVVGAFLLIVRELTVRVRA